MDLNCDLGEKTGNDTLLFPYISSCSIACGGHVGDVKSINTAIKEAVKHGVKVGAHPSYPDPFSFGRKTMVLSKSLFQSSIRKQLQLFKDVLDSFSLPWNHIKPHGALYNDLATDYGLAQQFLEVVLEFPEVKKIYCMAAQPIVSWVTNMDLIAVEEAFGDRAYNEHGRLVSRNSPQAVYTTLDQVEKQVKQLKSGFVQPLSGHKIPLQVGTVCIHSDTLNAPIFVQRLHDLLLNNE